jgi:hypothetical protein
MVRGRLRLHFVACLIMLGAASCTRPQPRPHEARGPEDVWLARIGVGPQQTARVCARGASDRIARYLCDRATPPIRGLTDLYRAIRLNSPAPMLTAAATHSLSLSARIVSEANPRVFSYQDLNANPQAPTAEQASVAAFVRGEQMVELAALDPVTFDFNFYLLRFEQACNQHRCTPEDLLTERIERNWTAWTLYGDRDLVDTPLDCVSCHQPFGAGTHKQFLMRQFIDPWMHWGGFRGGDERSLCPVPPADGSPGRTVATVEGLDLLRTIEGATGRYAGIPVAELLAAESGRIFTELLVNAEGLVRASPYGQQNNYPYSQLVFSTREVLCERLHAGTSRTWDEARQASRTVGLPVPFYGPDVVDRDARSDLVSDRTGLLKRRAHEDAFDVAATFLAPEVSLAAGFVPATDDSAETILRAMCIRCHSSATDPTLRRARFKADAIATVDPVTASAIRHRIALPGSSPEAMPPRRVGTLSGSAIGRIGRYLTTHCTQPGACD